MHTHFEYLAGISNILRKHSTFTNGSELYMPHDTLDKGWASSSGARRFIMSYRSCVNWLGRLEEDHAAMDLVAEHKGVVMDHADLMRFQTWQLCMRKCMFTTMSEMKSTMKLEPISWRLCMVELNSDYLDASKKVLINQIQGKAESALADV